jgi:hypothetical protein
MSSAHLHLERAVRGSALAVLTEIALKVLVRNELAAMSAEPLTEPINFRMVDHSELIVGPRQPERNGVGPHWPRISKRLIKPFSIRNM